MKVFDKLNTNKGIAIALGFFDGMHLGHKKIINTLINESRIKDYKTAVVTFNKNPADWFSATPVKSIHTFKDKELILESMGIDYLYELNFEHVKDLDAYNYIKNVLYNYFEPKLIVAGFNHTFGKERTGNSDVLKKYSQEFNYDCIIVSEQTRGEEKINSTIIREEVEKGNLYKIEYLLGRPFSIRNSVIKGKQLASRMGYPTANLIWGKSLVKLPYGVYFGYTMVDGKIYHSMINWGIKPTVSDTQEELLESYIYDFNDVIYGKIINVIFKEKLRDEIKFSSVDVLENQIHDDFRKFKKWIRTGKIK